MAKKNSQDVSRSKTVLFGLAAITIPVVVLLLAEGILRLAGVGAEYRTPFEPVEGKPEYIAFSPDFARRYFSGFQPSVAFNPFLPSKGDSTFRVFALGGSSTAGFPYSYYYGFPARLQARLETVQPELRPEVINLGVTAVNSYTLWHLKDYLMQYEPDAVVIYAGHNEYYGAFGAGSTIYSLGNRIWLKRLTLKLKSSALFTLLDRALTGAPTGAEEIAEAQSRTMMAQVVGKRSIPLGGNVYDAGVEQFRSNITAVVEYFRNAGVPVYLSTVTSNLTQSPLGEDSTAAATFREGTRLLRRGNNDEARRELVRAANLDNVRFRAPDTMNAIIRDLAMRGGVTLVDVCARFRAASQTGIPGEGQFVDHLHPNFVGYDAMGAEFFTVVADHPALKDTARSAEFPSPAVIDPIDRATAEIQIARLKNGFPFRKSVNPRTELRLYSRILDRFSRSGSYADSLAVLAVNRAAPIYDLLYQGIQFAQARSDTLNALLMYRALLQWQPFNESINRAAVSYALGDPHYDWLTSEIALGILSRSAEQGYLDALAAIRLRQGRLDDAERFLRSSERVDPTSQTMLYNYARLHATRGDSAAARDYFRRFSRASKP